MKIKSILRLSYLAMFVILLLQSCEDKTSFGEDLQVAQLPTVITYPDILDVREFTYVESAVPFMNTNGHPVTFELANIKKGTEILDDSYLNSVNILNYSVIDSIKVKNKAITDPNDPDSAWYFNMNDLAEMGKIIIEDGNPFANGEYFFSLKGSAEINGKMESRVYDNALRLVVGPDLLDGIAYCPFKMNFVKGEGTSSGIAELFGGNPDVRFELATEVDKLSIDPSSGAISANPAYNISETEYLKPIINVISNISDEIVSVEEAFTAVLSAAPIELEKDNNYFFFPTLLLTSKQNAALGGDGYSRVFVEHSPFGAHIKAGDPEETTDWFVTKACWRNHKNSPVVDTPDALEVRADAGVTGTQTLEHQMWTITGPSESWIVMDPANLALYEGCFNSKVVFWYKINMNDNSGYEEDGSTPVNLEVHITNNYTGNVKSTDWTQVNDVLECEIDNNGTIMTGTPYPGDQSGVQPPDGVKDLNNSPNNLWVRGELDLTEYKSEEAFTIAFRLKTTYDEEPYYQDPNTGDHVLNGSILLSNVHFVATEK